MRVIMNQKIHFSNAVDRTLEKLLDKLGHHDIGSCFFSSIREIADVDRIYCFTQRSNLGTPSLFCTWTADPISPDLIDRYRTFYSRVDPIRAVFPSIAINSCAAITFSSEEIEHSDYRSRCFDRYSIRHRLSVIRRTENAWLTLSLARRSRHFSDNETSEFSAIARVSLPIFVRHEGFAAKTASGNFSVNEVERRLEALGRGLTRRELQVCARTIGGLTAEGAAIDLQISVPSVLTYRRRAYNRLNVSSALQLAAIIFG